MTVGSEPDPVSLHQRAGTDRFIDNLETLVYAIEQRTLEPDQVERLARILARAERDVLATAKLTPAERRVDE